jgi:hypothetical protein
LKNHTKKAQHDKQPRNTSSTNDSTSKQPEPVYTLEFDPAAQKEYQALSSDLGSNWRE